MVRRVGGLDVGEDFGVGEDGGLGVEDLCKGGREVSERRRGWERVDGLS